MNNVLCKIISPQGDSYQCHYADLDSFCKVAIKNYLEDSNCSKGELYSRKQHFLNFKKQYQTFEPFFDYLFYCLGYKLENPFLISNSELEIKEKNKTVCYFAKYTKDISQLNPRSQIILKKPLFIQGNEKNIIKEQINFTKLAKLDECFITEDLISIRLKGNLNRHNEWAQQWVHDLIIQKKEACQKYVSALNNDDDIIYYDQGGFLQQFLPWIRFSIIDETTRCITFNSNKLSQKQECLIRTLKKENILLDCYCIDLK